MLNDLFNSVISSETTNASFDIASFLLCTLCSLVLGALIAGLYTFRNTYSKSFVVTLALLPAIVQVVIMMVNGNLGTGVAVMGAFSLIRFRSAPGTAKEICSIFLSMAVGLATGIGYLAIAALFVIIIGGMSILYSVLDFGGQKQIEKDLRIVIPENLDYTDVFDDLFNEYTSKCELVQVKTTNMGSLYKIHYRIVLKDIAKEKALLDELRCRNGNLEVLCATRSLEKEELL